MTTLINKMWNFLVITAIFGFCVLVRAETSISTQQSKYGPLEPPECGTNARIGTLPWIVAILRKHLTSGYQDRVCTGSIISVRHVLSAVGCVHWQEYQYMVRPELTRDENFVDETSPRDVRIERIDIHPNFSRTDFDHDIAVLKLERDLQFTKLIKPICLPTSQDVFGTNYEGTEALIVGWSIFRLGRKSPISRLRTALIEVVSESSCFDKYEASMQNKICGRRLPPGQNACIWDQSSPLMIENDESIYIIGILSFGNACGRVKPPVFTDVSSYLEWIVSKLN